MSDERWVAPYAPNGTVWDDVRIHQVKVPWCSVHDASLHKYPPFDGYGGTAHCWEAHDNPPMSCVVEDPPKHWKDSDES